MHKVVALLQSSGRAARSYRLRLVMSIAALAFSVLPLWYAANALQPLMGSKITGQGTQYSSFLIVGMVVYGLLMVTVNALPTAIGAGISNGSLEALLATRITAPELMIGLLSFDLFWALVRSLVMVLAAALLGVHFAWGHALAALPVLLLILLAYFPFALLGAASVLAFRTAGPLPQVVLVASGLLGGTYFPTNVVPNLVRHISDIVPLTYGLRALRAIVLNGSSWSDVSTDVLTLVGMTLLMFAVSIAILSATLRRVRRGGGLSQY